MKVYELFILIIFASFAIYYNLIHDDKIEIIGCIDLGAVNYNPEANKSCKQCCKFKQEKDCTKERHPCLCLAESIKGTSDCYKSDINSSLLFSLTDLESIGDDEDRSARFHKLISSAYTEHYYSKIMEISQITYMDYVHSENSNKSKRSPQYDMLLSIEFMKRGDYQKALIHINKFIDAPKIYSENPESAFFNKIEACCNKEIDWITNENHNSFKIAKILKNILIALDSESFDDDFLKSNFIKLSEFDNTGESIDFIENLIFSILLSIDGQSIDFSKYDLKPLKSYKYILLSSLTEIFNQQPGSYFLSSQLNILTYIKLVYAKNYLNELNNNDAYNSLRDIEALKKYIELKSKYNFPSIDEEKRMMIREKDTIENQYEEAYNVPEDIKPIYYAELIQNYISRNLGNEIIRSSFKNLDSNENFKFSDINLLSNKNSFDSLEFVTKSRSIIDYDIFNQSIDRFSMNQFYPIFKESLIEDLDNIVNNHYIASSNRNYNYETNFGTTTIYQNDIQLIEVYKHLVGLHSDYSIIKDILDSHNDNKISANLLINSISQWYSEIE